MDSRETVYKRPPNFCPDCGNKLIENAAYCSACGAPVKGAIRQPMTDIDDCIKKLSLKEQIAGIVWIVVGVFQIIIGYIGSFIVLLLGAVNIITGITRLKQSQKVQTPYSGMVDEYRKKWKSLVVDLILNLLMGGVVGLTCMIATLCDVNTRKYVLKNETALKAKEPCKIQ